MTPPLSTTDRTVPLIAITCGDPSGIGPEVACLAWANPVAHARAALRVVAEPAMLAAAIANRRGMPPLRVETVATADRRPSTPDTLLVIESGDPTPTPPIRLAEISAAGGRAAARAVEAAFAATRTGHVAAIVTGPLHKEALHAAGYEVPGHTELLARACGLRDDAASMMLWLPAADRAGLGVVHATLHESLRTALARLSPAAIEAAGTRLASLLAALLGRPPRIAVAALASAGIAVTGPLPADTLFLRASQGEFDGVVALYHDQGHIPIKLLGMHRAVNITLGLPLVRTSVAHGTGFDIVGTGHADPASMLAAIDAAARLVAADWPGATASAGASSPPSR